MLKPLKQNLDISRPSHQPCFSAFSLHLLDGQLLGHLARQLCLGNLLFQFDAPCRGPLGLAS